MSPTDRPDSRSDHGSPRGFLLGLGAYFLWGVLPIYFKAIASIAKVNADGANVYKAPGTPTFFINGKIVPNVASWAGLEPALKAAGAR